MPLRLAPTLPNRSRCEMGSRGDCKGIGYRLAIDFRMRSHSTQRCFSGWPVLRAAVWSAKLAPDLMAFGTSAGFSILAGLGVLGRPGFSFSRFHAGLLHDAHLFGTTPRLGNQRYPQTLHLHCSIVSSIIVISSIYTLRVYPSI